MPFRRNHYVNGMPRGTFVCAEASCMKCVSRQAMTKMDYFYL